MLKNTIVSDRLSKPRVPLSHAVRVGNLVFVSGATPYNADHELAKGNFTKQMHQVMENLKNILDGAGSSLERVVKVNVILQRISDFREMNEIYRTYFDEKTYPARTTIEAKLSNADFLLEIECVAEV